MALAVLAGEGDCGARGGGGFGGGDAGGVGGALRLGLPFLPLARS
jgi:hypothetical protein